MGLQFVDVAWGHLMCMLMGAPLLKFEVLHAGYTFYNTLLTLVSCGHCGSALLLLLLWLE